MNRTTLLTVGVLALVSACGDREAAEQPAAADSNFAPYPEPGAPPTPENVIPGGTSQDADIDRALINSLRNMISAQEVYFVAHTRYAKRVQDLDFVATDSASITITEANEKGWAAYATHPRMPNGRCAVFLGPVTKPEPATIEAQPQCTP
jgi:hypothetical protein